MKKRIYNQTALFGPLYAYLVVISPPEMIKKQISQIKNDLNSITPINERNLNSIAHITLTEKLTDDINYPETIEKLIGNINPFSIKINGWDYFDHGHSITIYLKIKNPQPIVSLMKNLKSPNSSPHISIAKRIPHETLNLAASYLENLNYSAEWNCTKIKVLRKLMSEKHLGFRESFDISL